MNLLMLVLACVALVVVPRLWWYLVRRVADGVPDPALRLGRVRRYVDADGRSGYRPEFAES
jgi:hypothetical protein